MPKYKLTCPKCGKNLTVDESLLGKTGKCPACSSWFSIPANKKASSSSPSAKPSENVPADPDTREISCSKTSSGDEVPAVWQPGDVILDLYEVTGELGEGGMGKVYKVHHRGWNVDLAVKSPRPELLQKSGELENFERECETWVNLGLYPHTVSCYYVRRLGGTPRVFAEFVDGGDLQTWIRDGRLYEGGPEEALKRILDISIQFAWGLHFAHEKGLIHQDVKPANVMLTVDGTAKVTDFGFAKARALAGETEQGQGNSRQSILVSSGGMTPAYCSPEQANREPLSRKTDIWSWGVSVLEMFTGDVTWSSGVAAREALEGYLEMGSGDDRIPKMPQGVVELLQRCFLRDSQQRPQDMLTVAAELQVVYQSAVGSDFHREAPKGTQQLADGLNDRGVSLLDLGKQAEAEQAFEQALQTDPHHPQAVYNLGLLQWRSGRITDEEVVRRMEEVRKSQPNSTIGELLLARIHLERDDCESAIKLLEPIQDSAENRDEIASALKQSHSRPQHSARCLRTFEGHTDTVSSVAISPDGRTMLSGSHDTTLKLWDLATGDCLRTFTGHTFWVLSVAISPNGRWGLSDGITDSMRLWELSTGKCLRTFEYNGNRIESVAISPDGHWGLLGSPDKTLQLWELATGKHLRTLEGHTDNVSSVAISSDGRWGLSGSHDTTLKLWDLASGKCLRTFAGHKYWVTSVAISPDGRWGLSWCYDKTRRLWNLVTGECLRTFEGNKAFTSVVISRDGRLGLSDGQDGTLNLWLAATGEDLHTLKGHTSEVTRLEISPDGGRAVSWSKDRTLRLWDLATGRCVRTISFAEISVTEMRIGTDGRLFLVTQDSKLRLWDLTWVARVPAVPFALTRPSNSQAVQDRGVQFAAECSAAQEDFSQGKPDLALVKIQQAHDITGYERVPQVLEVWNRIAIQSRRCGLRGAWHVRTVDKSTEMRRVQSVAISPDARWGLSVSIDDHQLRLLDLASGECLRTFEGYSAHFDTVAISPDGCWALSGGADKTDKLWDLAYRLKLWNLSNGECLRTFDGHSKSINSVAISPDGLWGLSGSCDTTLRLWDLASGRCLRKFEGHVNRVTCVATSPNGRWVMSASYDHTLRLWDILSGKCLRTFKGHTSWIESVAFSPDGRWGLSGSDDKSVKLWDLASGNCLRTYSGHTDDVMCVVFSPDGRWGLSGSKDKTLRLWDLASGECLRTLTKHVNSVVAVSISPDGRWVLSGSEDWTVNLWELDWELETPKQRDWDEGARPHLENFLTLQTPFAAALPNDREPTEAEVTHALTRHGKS